MADSSIQHPDDTPVSRIDILKMKQDDLRKFIENIQAKREDVFRKRNEIKKKVSKAKLDDVTVKIEGILNRVQKKVDKCDALLTDALDYLTKIRALELELEYLDQQPIEGDLDGEDNSEGSVREVDGES